MARVNLISYTAAKEIAANYFKTGKIHSLFVTRDGQVFYPENKHYIKMHEKANKLEASWFFKYESEDIKSDSNKPVIEVDKSEDDYSEDDFSKDDKAPITKAKLIEYFQSLTDKGEIELSKWDGLKFAQLRELYEEINKGKK